MATTTRSPLTEQAEKLQNLARHLSDGRLLEPVLRMAQTGDVWSGAIQEGFLSWMQFALDGWVRTQLAQGVRLVAESLANRAAEIERAAQAAVASGGQVPMAPLPPPAPLNYSPGRPPEFGDIGGSAANNKFNTERMAELARLLESTADGAVIDFARKLRADLEPPLASPPPPGAPPFVSPLPPDTAVAAGDPGNSSPGANAYLALADELHKAADDIERRIRQLSVYDEPLPTATLDSNLFAEVGAGAAAGAESSSQATSGEFIGPVAPARSLEDLEKAQHDGAAAGDEVGEIVGARRWDDKDHEKLFLALNEAEKHVDDPEYAVAFMKSFVPDGLANWCKLMNNSVIDLRVETDILRPMSRLFATATHQGEQFPPETRNGLMNSRCLDTLVHYGNFETEFAAEAARKILKDPDFYERSDKSDRVYAEFDAREKLHKGDARLGALKMLANNPAAATEILESYGEDGRRLIFKALEDDDLVGKEAAIVLERGLANFPNRKLSEDTLELIIKDSAEGRLDLSDHGKRAMARLLSSEEGTKRLLEVARADAEEVEGYRTSDEGFRIAAGTVKEFMGKLLDDDEAKAELLRGMAAQNAIRMKQDAQNLGAKPIDGVRESLSELKETIKEFSVLNQLIADGVEGASSAKEANAFMSAGLNLVIGEAVKLVPGGFVGKFVLDKALETAGDEFITKKVLSEEEKKRVKALDEEGLKDDMDRSARYLTLVALLRDKGITDQLVPADSPLRRWDKDGDGLIEMPNPPLAGTKAPKDWQDFANALHEERRRGSPIGKAVQEIEGWVEIWKSE